MAEFLTTNGISYEIENIIEEAKNNLFLISPYLQISRNLYERLKDASIRGVKITIVYGKDNLTTDVRQKLEDIKYIDLFYSENLHAKCYFNEDKMIITSMNMYEFSEKNNREMGVLIKKVNDKILFEKAKAEVNSIIHAANHYLSNTIKNSGYCLRCKTEIELNREKPYCKECYSSWAFFENYRFRENFCHSCGNIENSSMLKPLCDECFYLS